MATEKQLVHVSTTETLLKQCQAPIIHPKQQNWPLRFSLVCSYAQHMCDNACGCSVVAAQRPFEGHECWILLPSNLNSTNDTFNSTMTPLSDVGKTATVVQNYVMEQALFTQWPLTDVALCDHVIKLSFVGCTSIGSVVGSMDSDPLRGWRRIASATLFTITPLSYLLAGMVQLLIAFQAVSCSLAGAIMGAHTVKYVHLVKAILDCWHIQTMLTCNGTVWALAWITCNCPLLLLSLLHHLHHLASYVPVMDGKRRHWCGEWTSQPKASRHWDLRGRRQCLSCPHQPSGVTAHCCLPLHILCLHHHLLQLQLCS